MRHRTSTLWMMLAAVVFVGCGGATPSLDSETADLVDRVESEVGQLGKEIEGIVADDEDLAAAWSEIEVELTEALAALRQERPSTAKP